MVSFRLGKPDADYLSVAVSGRPRPDANDRDVNWLDAEVEVRAGGFSGRFGAKLLVGELSLFRERLAALHSFDSRKVELEATDGQVAVYIEGDGLGNFDAKCELLDEWGHRLTCFLNFDQTEIPAVLDGLDAVLRAYPFIKF